MLKRLSHGRPSGRTRRGWLLGVFLVASAVVLVGLREGGELGEGVAPLGKSAVIAGAPPLSDAGASLLDVADVNEAREASPGPETSEARAAAYEAFGEVVVTVRARDGHKPVANATLWTVPSQSEMLTTGRDGTVRFQAEAPALLVGVESAPMYLLWDPRNMEDGVEGEVGSKLLDEVSISPDGSTSIDLFVRLGVTLRGSVVDAEGAPVPRARIALAEAAGNRWEPAHIRMADEFGDFEFMGLAPNWYLVGPDPDVDGVFHHERIRADWGSVHELTLQYLPTFDVVIELCPESLGPEDPWPFPAGVRVKREDKILPRGRRPTRPTHERHVTLGAVPPVGSRTIVMGLCEGPYELLVLGHQPPAPATEWVGRSWYRSYRFTVDAEGKAHFAAPGQGNRAVLTGMDEMVFLDATVTGEQSTIFITWEGAPENQLLYVGFPERDPNGAMSIRGAIDIGMMKTPKLYFSEKFPGTPQRPMGTLDLVPGTNEITLNCLGEVKDG